MLSVHSNSNLIMSHHEHADIINNRSGSLTNLSAANGEAQAGVFLGLPINKNYMENQFKSTVMGTTDNNGTSDRSHSSQNPSSQPKNSLAKQYGSYQIKADESARGDFSSEGAKMIEE